MTKAEMEGSGFASRKGHVTKGGSLPSRSSRPRQNENATEEKAAANSENHTAIRGVQVSTALESVIVNLISTERQSPGSNESMTTPNSGANHSDGMNSGNGSQETDPNFSGKNIRIPVWKRSLDLALIFISLPIWLPVMILLMLWVKMVSPGPVFYRQERVGFRRKPFMIFKFRTMHVNVETDTHERHFEQLIEGDRPMTKLDACGDPRLIRFGRFLRAAGLDELPQLFNVIRGEMSLVGPRPCTVREFSRYRPYQRERFDAAPGLTGYWQVNGKNKTTFSEMIAMDIHYSKHLSLGLDLMVILKTIPAILTQVLESKIGTARVISKPKPLSRPPTVISWNTQ